MWVCLRREVDSIRFDSSWPTEPFQTQNFEAAKIRRYPRTCREWMTTGDNYSTYLSDTCARLLARDPLGTEPSKGKDRSELTIADHSDQPADWIELSAGCKQKTEPQSARHLYAPSDQLRCTLRYFRGWQCPVCRPISLWTVLSLSLSLWLLEQLFGHLWLAHIKAN